MDILTLSTSKTLGEAIKVGYVVRRPPDYEISNQYWRWCESNSKPFVAITLGGPKARYATVEFDLYCTSLDGFSSIAVYEILHFILGLKLKPGSWVTVGPIWTEATVGLEMAVPAASFFYRSAIDEGGCRPQKELIKLTLERAGETACRHKRAASVTFDATRKTLEWVATRGFWDSLISEEATVAL